MAHRGGNRVAPEHTLAAYGSALELGAHVLELDTFVTLDGEVVVIHDNTINRTTDGTGRIEDLTLEAIRAFDAGYTYGGDRGFPYRGQGLRVPTITEVIEAFPEACYAVELKVDDERLPGLLLEAFRSAGLLDRTVFVSFLSAPMRTIRAMEPTALTGLAIEEMSLLITPDETRLEGWEPPGAFAQLPDRMTDDRSVERAQRFGVELHPWTVNDAEAMERLIEYGVGGIITDDPATLVGLLTPR